MTEQNPFSRLFSAKHSRYTATLAKLAPGKHYDNLDITLVTVVPSKTTYDCVSYDRSSSYTTTEITIDGKPKSIPSPLEQALRCLRRENSTLLIWADLLTGDSAEERNRAAAAKAQLMTYSRRVICFSNTGNERSKEIFDVLKILAGWWFEGALRATASSVPGVVQCKPERLREWLVGRDYAELRLADTGLWNEIHQVFSSSYFRSPQAMADVVMGRKTIVRSGRGLMLWRNFYMAFLAYIYLSPELKITIPKTVLDSFDVVTSIEIAVQRTLLYNPPELLYKFQCDETQGPRRLQDPRELVFSMLPIAGPSARVKELKTESEHLPTIDYRKSTTQVFTEASRYILHERQDTLLWNHQSAPCKRRVQGLPTWACDFSTPAPNESDLGRIRLGFRDWSNSITPKKRMFVDAGNALHVQAHALDRIEYVSEILNEGNCRRLITDAYLAIPNLDGESAAKRIDKFWRALVLDPPSDAGELMRDANSRHEKLKWSFMSLLAEECILKGLGCTVEEFASDVELRERAKVTRVVAAFGKLSGRSEGFEDIVKRNSLGRRVFSTAEGRVGMTAIEAPVPGDDEDEQNMDCQTSNLGDDKVPERLGGQHAERTAAGVHRGDAVVALVGGVFPYILRPSSPGEAEDDSIGGDLRESGSYNLVGECHLQGVMDGELFKDTDDLYGEWKSDLALVDVLIV